MPRRKPQKKAMLAAAGGAVVIDAAADPSLPNRERVKRALSQHFFLRGHMFLILGGTISVGMVATRLLLALDVNHLAWRYGLSVILAFAAFVGFVRLWLWYVGYCADSERRSAGTQGADWLDAVNFSSGGIDLPSFGGTSSGADLSSTFTGGGGRFGGGGATGSWGSGSSSGGGSKSSFDLDLGDDWGVVILLVVLVAAIAFAAFYVIYAAPVILGEAAFQTALAAALTRRTKKMTASGWIGSVVRATILPFLVIFALAVTLGWYANKQCPTARRLSEALNCVSEARQ